MTNKGGEDLFNALNLLSATIGGMCFGTVIGSAISTSRIFGSDWIMIILGIICMLMAFLW